MSVRPAAALTRPAPTTLAVHGDWGRVVGSAGPVDPARPSLEILLHGPLRGGRELAQRLDLSTASLSRITRPLVEAGLVVELPDVTTGAGGRPPQPLDIDAGRQHVVGRSSTADTLMV